jgi:hypothetical protein
MPLTNKERQAAFRAKRKAMIAELKARVAKLEAALKKCKKQAPGRKRAR